MSVLKDTKECTFSCRPGLTWEQEVELRGREAEYAIALLSASQKQNLIWRKYTDTPAWLGKAIDD